MKHIIFKLIEVFMQPLADKLRPTNFLDVYGQNHLVGPNGPLSAMLKKGKFLSFILYGPPGCGKTTIARIFAENSGLEYFFFNASTDSKAKLKDIISHTNYYNILIVIDELHRMKTDIQDYLLPFMENGKAVIIGITTQNPYMSVNIAIRSRCHIYEVKEISNEEIKRAVLSGIKKLDEPFEYDENAIDTIVLYSNNEVRSALNLVESLSLIANGKPITSNIVRNLMGKPPLDLDHGQDHYYQILSALQKSIRGSDVDAALHYLARLVVLGDLDIILRRLMIIAYEDIGLANPSMGQKVLSAGEVCRKTGFPEARIPLSVIVVEMALSPKSNTAMVALDKAIADFLDGKCGPIPPHVDNKQIKLKPSIYRYPHNDFNSVNDQQHLPLNMLKVKYYIPKSESHYEKALAERKAIIDKLKKYS